jgi:hypothetical protein
VVGLGRHEGRELGEEHSLKQKFLLDMRFRGRTCNTQNLGGTKENLSAQKEKEKRENAQ